MIKLIGSLIKKIAKLLLISFIFIMLIAIIFYIDYYFSYENSQRAKDYENNFSIYLEESYPNHGILYNLGNNVNINIYGKGVDIFLRGYYISNNETLYHIIETYANLHQKFPEVENCTIGFQSLDPPEWAEFYCKGEWIDEVTYKDGRITDDSLKLIINKVESTYRGGFGGFY